MTYKYRIYLINAHTGRDIPYMGRDLDEFRESFGRNFCPNKRDYKMVYEDELVTSSEDAALERIYEMFTCPILPAGYEMHRRIKISDIIWLNGKYYYIGYHCYIQISTKRFEEYKDFWEPYF